jgi:hypothetical protein
VASRNIESALAFLPNSHSSSTSTRLAFLPDTVAASAATTFRVALVYRDADQGMIRMTGVDRALNRFARDCHHQPAFVPSALT